MIRDSSALRALGIVDVTQGHNTVSFSYGGKTITCNGFSTKSGFEVITDVGPRRQSLRP